MRKPIAISELLTQGKATLERLKTGGQTAQRALAALQRALPPEIAEHVWSAQLSAEGVLTAVADSGGWATRVRYVISEAANQVAVDLEREIVRVVVRVRPKPGGR